MPSEQRLHPFSMLFAFGGILKQFALPGLIVLIAGRSASGPEAIGERWDVWTLLFLVPAAAHAVVRYLTYRIRYESEELIIRSGLLFRNERHVPFARIQNLEAVRNVVHRVLGVVEVRVENASGREPEATISVLPDSAFDEMRRRVFAGRSRQSDAVPDPAAPAERTPAETGRQLLRLSSRQLLLAGFIENRGLVLIATIYGFFWQLGPLGDFWTRLLEGSAANAGVRETLRSIVTGGASVGRVAAIVAGILGLLILVRVISMAWALVRLHDFTLTLAGDDLRMEFGLLTRVATTTPRRRIQTLTIRHTPLHRLFGQTSIRIETAGGRPAADGSRGIEREWIAPIIADADVPAFLRSVLPELTLDTLDWRPVHPRAFRRAVKPAIVLALATAAAAAALLGRYAIVLLPFTLAWFVMAAKKWVDHLRWSLSDDVVALRSGWLTRVTTAARVAKVQAVDYRESPFDRRTVMARVKVDTAGAGGHRIDIPYLPREVAASLHRRLAVEAAATDFRW
jgi:putative membrane protein